MIRANVSVTVKDVALRQLEEKMRELSKWCTTVGWHADTANQPHKVFTDKGAVVYDPRNSVLATALLHEMGSVAHNIPARPMLGTAARTREFRDGLGVVAAMELRAFYHGGSKEKVLDSLGLFWKKKVREVFKGRNRWARLSSRRVAERHRHGITHDMPLLDTGDLLDNVKHRTRVSSSCPRTAGTL